MAEITSTNGYTILIDDEDLPLVSQWNWHVMTRKGKPTYAVNVGKMKDRKSVTLFMHRLLMNAPKGLVVDHINNNGCDNRKANLRICTQSENMANQRPRKGYKGVSRWRHKFQAHICKDQKQMHLGVFESEVDAAVAYDNAARALFGSFALTNF